MVAIEYFNTPKGGWIAMKLTRSEFSSFTLVRIVMVCNISSEFGIE